MEESKPLPRSVSLARWVARIWSLLIFAAVLVMIFSPDPYATEPMLPEDRFLLVLWGIAVIGLLVAWRWASVGAAITVAALILREIAWVIIKGPWMVNFLLIWAVLLPPAALFVMASRWEKAGMEAPPNAPGQSISST